MKNCDRKGCKNLANMFPVIVLVGKNWRTGQQVKTDFQLGLNLCQEHCLPDKKEYIADNGWEQIDKVFELMYKMPPDHELSFMDFRPLEDRMGRLDENKPS